MSNMEPANQTQLRAMLEDKLGRSGERERLKELLRTRLVDSGWRDRLKSRCREIVQEKTKKNPNAGSSFSVDELIHELVPYARESVPPEIKQELVQRIQETLAASD